MNDNNGWNILHNKKYFLCCINQFSLPFILYIKKFLFLIFFPFQIRNGLWQESDEKWKEIGIKNLYLNMRFIFKIIVCSMFYFLKQYLLLKQQKKKRKKNNNSDNRNIQHRISIHKSLIQSVNKQQRKIIKIEYFCVSVFFFLCCLLCCVNFFWLKKKKITRIRNHLCFVLKE